MLQVLTFNHRKLVQLATVLSLRGHRFGPCVYQRTQVTQVDPSSAVNKICRPTERPPLGSIHRQSLCPAMTRSDTWIDMVNSQGHSEDSEVAFWQHGPGSCGRSWRRENNLVTTTVRSVTAPQFLGEPSAAKSTLWKSSDCFAHGASVCVCVLCLCVCVCFVFCVLWCVFYVLCFVVCVLCFVCVCVLFFVLCFVFWNFGIWQENKTYEGPRCYLW